MKMVKLDASLLHSFKCSIAGIYFIMSRSGIFSLDLSKSDGKTVYQPADKKRLTLQGPTIPDATVETRRPSYLPNVELATHSVPMFE